ncbi:hypothetical protein [Nocardia farcinica]|uniref:hypothetical protein n=1 Tax=Nocardia farcinica TaxID=37329 RepID=UPI001E50FA24|nr:hypothetical protein [Nocardia farcinica]
MTPITTTPELIIPSARDVLDIRFPVAVMFMGVLGHARSYAQVRRIMAAFPVR